MPISLEPYVSEKILFQRYVAPVNPDADMPAAIQAIIEFSQRV